MNYGELLTHYDSLVLFDTETTGLDYKRDEIIEFSAVVLRQEQGQAVPVQEYDNLVTLTPGNTIPPQIRQLTGITDEDVQSRGISKEQLCLDLARMLEGNALLMAYNAHFDLSFLFYLLLRNGDTGILRGKDKLDILTVYKDRRAYPHRLSNAIEAYGLNGRVVNSHRAIDDVLATAAVLEAMVAEKDDLMRYVNLFGYSSKYGLEGKPISTVTYRPQGYQPGRPLYEL